MLGKGGFEENFDENWDLWCKFVGERFCDIFDFSELL